MLHAYLLLKENFKVHEYPFDLLNPIITYYIKVYNFEIFIGGDENSSMIRTPNNQIHYWNIAGDHRKIHLSHVKKLVHDDCRAFAITENNDLYSWGSNDYGQLGINILVESYLNDQVKQATKVELSNVQNIVNIDKCVYAITVDGDVWYWGTVQNINKPQKTSLTNIKNIINADRMITISKTDEFYDRYSVHKNKIPNVKEAFVHNYRAIVLTSFGELFHFKIDRTPRKVELSNVSKVICNESSNQIILMSGKDTYWWKPDSNTLDKIEISNVKDVVHGGKYFLSLTHDHDIYSWGDNTFGQLGIRTLQDKKVPQKVFSNVRKILSRDSSSYAITHNNELYAWGFGYHGQLGLGHYENSFTIKKVQIENVKDIYFRKYCLIIVTWFGEIYYCGRWYDQYSNIPKRLHF